MKILRLPSVKAEMGHRSDASIYNAIREGLFPVGIKIGQRARGWPSDEVEAVITARVAGKSDDELKALVIRLHAKRLELPSA